MEIWKKFIFICSFGLVSAARGKTLGQILDDPALKAEVQSVIEEVMAVARGLGVQLPEDIAWGFSGERKVLPGGGKDVLAERFLSVWINRMNETFRRSDDPNGEEIGGYGGDDRENSRATG